MTPLDAATANARKTALARAAVLTAWTRSGLDADRFAARYNDHPTTDIAHLSRGTLYRWAGAHQRGGVAALLPGYRPTRGAGSRALDAHARHVLEALYLTPARPSAAKCARDAAQVLGRTVSEQAARSYLQSLPTPLIIKHRHGQTKYTERCLPYLSRPFEDLAAMQKVNADHHKLDALVQVDGKLRRPYLTVFSDVATRKPLAWMITEQPNELVIASTLHALLLDYGLPAELVIDNGADFKSGLLNGSAQDAWQGVFGALGVHVTFVQPYHGQSKPVERWFKTVAEEFSKNIPTYVGSNTVSRHEDTALYYRTIKKRAKRTVQLSLQDVSDAFDGWVANWSATWRHAGRGMNGMTPDEAFAAKWATKRVYDPAYDHLVFSREFSRTVRQRGITIGSSEYWTDELHVEIGRKIVARRPIWDLAVLHVYRADGRYLCTAQRADWDQTGDTEYDLKRRASLHRRLRAQLAKLEAPAHLRRAVLREARGAMTTPSADRIAIEPGAQEVVNFDHLPDPPPQAGAPNILHMHTARRAESPHRRTPLFPNT